MFELILLVPLILVLALAWKQLPRARWRGIARAEVERHRAVLRGKWLRAHDEYGSFDREAWREETDYFAESVIEPRIKRPLSDRERRRLRREVSRMALRAIERADAEAMPADPVAFEHRCAELLKKNGWDARTVGGSGDQGADVIATANGRTLVVQCKQYRKPIGNKAVQEAGGARAFYKAHMAAVVGTAPFTKSAYELADTMDVLLLDEAGLAALKPPFGRG